MAKNSFFRFKQFTIHQDKSAMKVCTDACVLGAWAKLTDGARILDIGAGTGLLSLMMAQRFPLSRIDAVELDDEAFLQANENVGQSPFSDRIHVVHAAVQEYNTEIKYDSVITNPPFFQSDLRSPDSKKNVAHHAGSLSFSELLDALDRLVSENGTFHILLPVDEGAVFLKKSIGLGWFLHKKLTLFHHEGKKPFRLVMTFHRTEVVDNGQINEALCIYEPDGKTYHPAFRELMKDYYLIF